ncbi:MAG: hypothetical protein FWJ90_02585 [Actinomadura sp.]
MRVTPDGEWAMIPYAGRRRPIRHRATGARTFPNGAAAPTAPDAGGVGRDPGRARAGRGGTGD